MSSHSYFCPRVRQPRRAFSIAMIRCVVWLRTHAKRSCRHINNDKRCIRRTRRLWSGKTTLNPIITWNILKANVSIINIILYTYPINWASIRTKHRRTDFAFNNRIESLSHEIRTCEIELDTHTHMCDPFVFSFQPFISADKILIEISLHFIWPTAIWFEFIMTFACFRCELSPCIR